MEVTETHMAILEERHQRIGTTAFAMDKQTQMLNATGVWDRP